MQLEELEASLREALEKGYRKDLLAKGQSRSIIMKNGVLPDEHPHYPKALSYNLLSFGYGLLLLSLKVNDMNGDAVLARRGFEQAGNAIEAVISNSDKNDPDYGFHITIAASAFHLGRFSARAYSLLKYISQSPNTSPVEQALSMLMRRSLDELNAEILNWCASDRVSDDAILALLTEKCDSPDFEDNIESAPHIEAVDLSLTENFFGSISIFLLSLKVGDAALFEQAIAKLKIGLGISSEINLVSQWWAHRIAIQLLSDLWTTSFHMVLPKIPEQEVPQWNDLRSLFIASLFSRKKGEIELWPSQMEAAKRSIDMSDNLIASLPTSAGKTRIAELAILRCLAEGQRVIFVTPLRALSAQTEVSLNKTFAPLGYKISTLYGSIGTSRYEEDAMRESHIVVATPEKIDFALRNDPDILNDIGLVVLDEGHMIGLNEREIRYETQIQRLLKRPDSHTRRIVCLSAILPEGDEFDDFVSWLRQDEEGSAIVSDWRPTRLRFGELQWQSNLNRGWLELKIGDERSFVPSYIISKKGSRPSTFPRDQHELVIASTWKLISEGHSVLIFCPLKKSVEPYADRIITAHRQGFIQPLLEENDPSIQLALAAGEEWLGKDHSILKCLKLGIAIHHGSLPTPFRREVEKLLQIGILRVTVSSPTLAQGLNLSATTILFHSLHRHGEIIKASEFKNIIGRAGRAFIDVEGLILYPMFKDVAKRQREWESLKNDSRTLSLESGLVRLVITILLRIRQALGGREVPLEELIEYVLNNASVWEFPTVKGEKDDLSQQAEGDWEKHLTFLDMSLLNLLGENDIPPEQLSEELDRILSSSLWERRLNRRAENIKSLCDNLLKERAKYIWRNSTTVQRKGYYLAGVGLSSGHQLDAVSGEANKLLVQLNAAIIESDNDQAIESCISLAEILFEIPPFTPKNVPDNWKVLIAGWLQGRAVNEISEGSSRETLDFIEDALVYRLPWGMEAIKVRAQANNDRIGDFSIDDFELSYAVPTLETGSLNISATVLMQSGFSSRIAAISAVESTDAEFYDSNGLKEWLASDQVSSMYEAGNWPTAETEPLWQDFVKKISLPSNQVWKKAHYVGNPVWYEGVDISDENFLNFHVERDGRFILLSKECKPLGELNERFSVNFKGLLLPKINKITKKVDFIYYGPDINS